MSHAEEQLYHACRNFCESFFHLLCEKEKMRHSLCDDYTTHRILEITNEQMEHDYICLFNAVEDFENFRKGSVNKPNKYKLKLEEIK